MSLGEYNLAMRVLLAGWLLLLSSFLTSQDKAAGSTSVTVPATIDHNRVVIRAEVRLPDGSAEAVGAWVDNGNPDLYMSRRLATALGLAVKCGDQECTAPPPSEIVIGGMSIPLTSIKEVKIPLRPVSESAVLALGLKAEINLPSSILKKYDVLIDFVDHKFSIEAPGSLHFRGSSAKVMVNADNGLIQVPSRIENKKYNLALDVGSCISFLDGDLFDKLGTAHKEWPRMTGAVGSANRWGAPEESKWNVMRVGRVEYGPLFLTDVDMVALPKPVMDFFEKRAGTQTVGLVGANMLQNYRVGFDYAHATVYFEIGRTFRFPDFDVIGLTLRPEADGRFTILGVPDLGETTSVPVGDHGVQAGDQLVAINDLPVGGLTMGQVWSMLGGTPGQERKLTIARSGRQFVVPAKVQHFLGEPADGTAGAKKK